MANIGERLANGVMNATPNTVDERQAFIRLSGVGSACLSYGYRAPVVFVRGGIAEALYKRIPAASAVHVSGVTSADLQAFQASEAARGRARLVDDRRFTEAASCLVVRAPRSTRTFLLSEHGSAAELVALNEMIADASGCTSAKRFPAAGGRSFIRAYVAEAAFRWAQFDHVSALKVASTGTIGTKAS